MGRRSFKVNVMYCVLTDFTNFLKTGIIGVFVIASLFSETLQNDNRCLNF